MKSFTAKVVVVVAALVLLVGVVGWRLGWYAAPAAVQAGQQGVPTDPVSISGVVLNASEIPEAGVWVIAETNSLPTPFRRIVVTDDQGRFLVPDLPDGSYEVWVRGYGLRDSLPVKASRGERLTLTVAQARTPQEAAKIYPANYWLSLFEPPSKAELPKGYSSVAQWMSSFKVGCVTCHQMGAELTRLWTRSDDWDVVWHRSASMNNTADGLGRELLKKHLAAWATRIVAGEVPPAPPRPTGLERNIVVTMWEWGQKDSYLHGTRSTDKRNPTLYPYGRVYGVDFGQDTLYALDPVKHTVSSWKIPAGGLVRDRPSSWAPYNNPGAPNSVNLDEKGGAWISMRWRPEKDSPKWAHDVIASNTDDPKTLARLAKLYDEGLHTHHQLVHFDTKTEQFVPINTVYGSLHLEFDEEGRLWSGSDSTGLGMIDTKVFDPKNPEQTVQRAQKLWMQLDPETNTPMGAGGYGIVVSPVDHTIWRANPYETEVNRAMAALGAPVGGVLCCGHGGNKLIKFDPKTRTFTDYPLPPPGRMPRGVDATTDGKIWFGAAGSGHLGRLDPKTGQFTYWESPGPKFKNIGKETGSADMHYYIWVDQFNTLGLGKDMVILNGTNSDALLAFDPMTEKFTVIRMAYPLGFFHRSLDGRIDDPNAGWKGRGIWVDYAGDPIMFTEKTQIGNIVHVQVRPDPLAR